MIKTLFKINIDVNVTKQPSLFITILETVNVLSTTCVHLVNFINTKEKRFLQCISIKMPRHERRIQQNKSSRPWQRSANCLRTSPTHILKSFKRHPQVNFSLRPSVCQCLFKHAFARFRWRVYSGSPPALKAAILGAIRALPAGSQPNLSSLVYSRAALINHHTTDGIDFNPPT